MRSWYVIFSLLLGLLAFYSCSESQTEEENLPLDELNAWNLNKQTIQGTTQGTTFLIKTSEDSLLASPKEISDLLHQFDLELSGYIDYSILSKLNDADSLFEVEENKFFNSCYALSQHVFSKTNGAFDPSVFPLVKAWGFFKDMTNEPSQQEIDSILNFVGFESGHLHTFDGANFTKLHPSFQLDFNGIAQGQSADEIATFLKNRGHENYFVEVGGEIVVAGKNNDGEPWIIGIDEPTEENDGASQRKLENYLSISEGGIATSGNYRKFYKKDGKKYSHTLNPLTGFPVEHNLLSATVIAPNAALADGYATVFMTIGVDSTLSFVASHPEEKIEVYLLFENNFGRIERAFSSGMQSYLLK